MDTVSNPLSEDFTTLWNQMHERLCWYVCSRVSNGQDVEDLLQDVFLRAYAQIPSVRDPLRIQPWLYQIARHRIIDYYRSRRMWTDLPETLAEPDQPEPEPVEELIPYLRQSVAALPADYREALVLSDLEGIPQTDLASQLGLSHSGAKTRVQRARQKVKALMLDCLDLEFDTRGGVMDYHRHCCC